MNEQTNMKRGFLKEKLGDYQVDPPEHVWNGISSQVSSGRNRRGFYILLLASAASIALAITLGIHFFGPDLPQQQSLLDELPVDSSAEHPDPVTTQIPRVESELSDPAPDVVPAIVSEPAAEVVKFAEIKHNAEVEQVSEVEQNTEVIQLTEIAKAMDPDYADDFQQAPETESETVVVPDPAGDVSAGLLPDTAIDLPANPFPYMEEEKKRDSRWMVGAVVSPLYSYRDAEAEAMPSNPGESGLLSYSTGVHVRYRRNSRLAFETGIYYNKTGIAIGAPEIKIFSRSQDYMVPGVFSGEVEITTMNNSVGNIVAYSGDIYMNGYKVNAENGSGALSSVVADDFQASESGIEQHLDYLELPFNLRYSVIDRTIELQLVGGMSTNFLVNNYVSMDGPSGREEIGYLSNLNTVNLSGNAGLGMIYHVSRKFSFLLEPRFRYFLNSVNDSSLPSTRPYSLGIYTGLNYTF